MSVIIDKSIIGDAKVIQVFGMKRSGHHGVISWILGHYRSAIHYNNCFRLDGDLGVANNKEIIEFGGHPYEVALLSFEDQPINNWHNLCSLGDSLSSPDSRVLVLRDPYNMYASRIHKKRHNEKVRWNNIWLNYCDVEIWKEYAREFVGDTDFLSCQIKINFNQWFSSEKYRMAIASHFGQFTDRGLATVGDFGGGSSFDGMIYSDRAQDMGVLDRWKKFVYDTEYISVVMSDSEMADLSRAIFGFAPNITLM